MLKSVSNHKSCIENYKFYTLSTVFFVANILNLLYLKSKSKDKTKMFEKSLPATTKGIPKSEDSSFQVSVSGFGPIFR